MNETGHRKKKTQKKKKKKKKKKTDCCRRSRRWRPRPARRAGRLADEILAQDKACERSGRPGRRLREHRQRRARRGHRAAGRRPHPGRAVQRECRGAPEGPQAVSQDGQAGRARRSKTTPRRTSSFTTTSISASRCSRIPPHRVLAINRGERAKMLRVRIEADEPAIEQLAIERSCRRSMRTRTFLIGCVRDALSRLLLAQPGARGPPRADREGGDARRRGVRPQPAEPAAAAAAARQARAGDRSRATRTAASWPCSTSSARCWRTM